MEIELITTKKKLTASTVKQIPFATQSDKEWIVETANNILGYVYVSGHNYIICRGKQDYVKIWAVNWKKGSSSESICLYYKNTYRKFESVEARDSWLAVHNKILEQGKLVHIYL